MNENPTKYDVIIYKKLVTSRTNIIGKLAFAYYFLDKKTFIEGFLQRHKKHPNFEDFDRFDISIEDNLQNYLNSAVDEITAFTTESIRAYEENREKENEARIKKQVEERLEIEKEKIEAKLRKEGVTSKSRKKWFFF